MQIMSKLLILGCIPLFFLQCDQPTKTTEQTTETKKVPTENWQQLFNGKDLTGWIPKIAGYPVGENFGNTFRVEEGILKVSYDQYDGVFKNRFGHLFYEAPFKNYHLKIDYRFNAPQIADGEAWAFKNSGVMFHGQSAESMGLEQGFPVSLEAQFLGGNGTEERPTANLCTPGMHVEMGDTLTTVHCIPSDSKTIHDNSWVNFELIVHPDGQIYHLVDGDTVIQYTKASIGGEFLPENYPDSTGTPISAGYLSLQSESHPIEFRKVEIMELK